MQSIRGSQLGRKKVLLKFIASVSLWVFHAEAEQNVMVGTLGTVLLCMVARKSIGGVGRRKDRLGPPHPFQVYTPST